MLKKRLPRRRITINGVRKRASHYTWWLNTGHWPVWPEIIHHIDGDSLNDEFSNLQLMSNSEHSIMHNTGKNHHFFGKKHTKESREKMSAVSGKRHYKWQGDAASPAAKACRRWYARKKNQPKTEGGRHFVMPSNTSKMDPSLPLSPRSG